ncbi:related to hypercellular protein (hypa) [Moesziomyces antarcticus]|nr:related to hypercellular protein (hypa) [Moesziomyces antarcticus]
MAAASSRPQSGFQAAPTPSPIGGRSFIDHAKLRILLAPVGDIDEAEFAKWCDAVRSFETIRLADLPSSCAARQKAARHAASGSSTSASTSPILQTGEIHLSFVTSYDPDHAFLAPFNMHRQVLGALGLATYSNNALNRHELEASPSALRELHPGALVHRVFGFDSGAKRPETVDLSSIKDDVAAKINSSQRIGSPLNPAAADAARPGSAGGEDAAGGVSTPKLPSSPDASGFSAHRDGGLIIFPAVRRDGKDVRFYLKTLLAELVGNILDALDHIVTGLEGTPLETPRETLDGIASRTASAPTSSANTASWLGKTGTAATGASLAAGMGAAASRASSLFGAFSSSSSSAAGSTTGDVGTGSSTPTSSRPSSAIGGGSHPFDLASPGSKTASPTSESTRSKILAANANKKSAKRVTSAAATGPTGSGRYAKVRADLHLLSGNLWDALEAYSSALVALGKERALAGGQDAVWFASALEGFSVARVLVSRMGGAVLEKAPCFDLPWSAANAKEKEKDKEKDKDGIPRPYAKQSWGEVAEAYTIALVIYAKCLAPPSVLLEPVRSVTNDSPRDYTHPLIHASACTQYARFLLAVWASGGWNGECFDQLVYGGVPPALAEEKPSNAMYLALTAVSGIARHDIAAAASSALTHSIIALKPTDQITLLSTLTAIFGCIGFSRREAHLLRQLQSTIVALLVKAKRVNAQPPATASLPLQQHAHFDKDTSELLGNMVAQTTFDSLGRGPEAVLVLAVQVCETYGIHVELDPLRGVPPFHILSRASEGLRSAYASPALAGSESWKADGNSRPSVQAALLTPEELAQEAPYGWKEQQIALLKEAIATAELLTDYVGMAFFGAILLRDFHALLDADEQRDLIVGMQRAVQAARWAGAQDLSLKYWGPVEPLCSLELLPLAADRLPHEREAKHIWSDPAPKAEEGVAGLNNPMFMNLAAARTSAKARATAVQDEPIHVMATLQNEFATELHIDSVKLVADGAGFVAEESERISIPPLSFHTVRLTGTAKEVGTVAVRGVTLTLAGGCTEEHTFLLPVYDEDNVRERRKRAAEAEDRKTRLKECGLDARSAVIKQKAAAAAGDPNRKASANKWIEITVVGAQPLVAAYCGALSPLGGLDMFEGESRLIQLELENVHASLAVNYVRVAFRDDASEAAQQALADGELLPADVHEVEWDLVHQPALSRDSSDTRGDAVHIEAGASTTLPVRVTAKAGCTYAVISLEYAHLDRSKGATTKVHVRMLEVAFRLTVHPVVVCRDLTIVPLRSGEADRLTRECLASADAVPPHLRTFDVDAETPVPSTPVRLEGSEAETDEEYCLVSIEVSNVFREDVLVRFALNTGGLIPLQLYRLLRAGTTTRIVLPHPRIELDATGQPATGPAGSGGLPAIPSVWAGAGTRQFIVSKLQLSAVEEAEMRATFWYRAALLQRLGGVWKTMRTAEALAERGGKVPLRGMVTGGLEMDAADREALQKPVVGITLAFGPKPVRAEAFVTVRATITNRVARTIQPIIRLVPTSPNDATHTDVQLLASMVLADGTWTAPRGDPIQPGEQVDVEWNVAFLSPGTFAFVVSVQEAEPQQDPRLALVSPAHTLIVLP